MQINFIKLKSWLQERQGIVGIRHSCWGECKTDSRYPDRWPKSLKELNESGDKVFIPFPNPTGKNFEKCKRWIVACLREHFTDKCITRNTYICALHWPGGKGPTAEFPDLLKGNLTTAQTSQACAPKRKAPKQRVMLAVAPGIEVNRGNHCGTIFKCP